MNIDEGLKIKLADFILNSREICARNILSEFITHCLVKSLSAHIELEIILIEVSDQFDISVSDLVTLNNRYTSKARKAVCFLYMLFKSEGFREKFDICRGDSKIIYELKQIFGIARQTIYYYIKFSVLEIGRNYELLTLYNNLILRILKTKSNGKI